MNGLLKKDLITFKKAKFSSKFFELIPAAVFLIAWQGKGAILLGSLVLPFLAMFSPFYLSTLDEQWKWDKYAISLPVSKKQIVASRYLASCSIITIYFLFSLVLNIGAYYWFQEHSISIHLASALIGLGVSLFFVFLLLPTNYTIGNEASSVAMIILMVLTVVAVNFLRKTDIDILSLAATTPQMLFLISTAFLMMLFVVSYLISVNMYHKKHS